jgi:hypothetical protein
VNRVSDDGSVSLSPSAPTHLIADVMGYFTDDSAPALGSGLFEPLAPSRLADTRLPSGGGKLAPGHSIILCTAASAGGAVLNVTATEADAPGFVQVVPAGQVALGTTSNVNVERAGQTIPNAVVTSAGTDPGCPGGRAIQFYTYAGTHLIADVFGVFTA